MVTGSPPSETHPYPSKRPVWPWAAGSILIPLVIVAATLAGARFVARNRLAAMIAPAPDLPPLRVVTAIQPPAPIALWGLGSSNGAPVALVYTTQGPSACLPSAACPGAPLANQLGVYGGAGAPQFTRSMTPTDLSQCAPPEGSAPSLAYLVCPGQVQAVSLATGETIHQFALPAGLDTIHATLDVATNTLFVTGNSALYAFDLTSGKQLARQPVSGSASAPIVDSNLQRVYVLLGGGGPRPSLEAFQSRALNPLGGAALPAGWSAGPRDDGSNTLYCFGKAGLVGAIDLGASSFSPTQPYPTITPDPTPPLTGALALGWDPAQVTLVALYADHVTAYDAESLQPFAAAPVAGAWDAQRPLPVDTVRGALYTPDASGAIVALSLTRPRAIPAPDAATALMMARAGLGALLPDTNQTPPFLDAQTFPVTQTTLARNFAIHYSDLGWRGPYPGHASARVVKAGTQPGDYIITFAVDWNQLFVHTHSWTVELLSDGRVKLLADTGDAIP